MIQQKGLSDYIKKGINLSKELSRPVLISQVKEMKNIDPLLFFSAGKRTPFETRSFWSNPTNDTIIVGLGEAYTISDNESTERFDAIEKQWKRLVQHSIIIDDFAPYSTGPILMGGFSFDPLKKRTELWDNFDDAKFVLPVFMLSYYKGNTYLTTNIICEPTGTSFGGSDLEQLEVLLEESYTFQKNNSFTKEEVQPQEWMDSVRNATKKVQNGEVEKVVLAREIKLHFDDPIEADAVLARLKEEQPMSYLFAIEYKNSCFIGASPERLIKKKGEEFLTTCLAGSIRRGKTSSEDKQLENELLHDPKNLHEHDVVVQMIKNAMKESCTSISSPRQPGILKMRDIQHLYTPVKGIAKDDVSLLTVVNRLHPTPALGGQPKQMAFEIIRDLEILDRGWYGSPVGWFDINDNGEFAVAIRSGLLNGNNASLFAGCGIVGDSQPESEYTETMIKFRPMLSALGGLDNE
ncbi:isochorismate synthase [Fredinandcohnia sp. QZ13]|uniref:isochorismate synthase n=1 Tax=Fredinandcohnia sp. QZ13 TaxID=3073144 RepID=UPI002852F9E6|nr:isochorismate synthase [Fredinandcohnia sp. QZ13]MDR4889342.1 isochorismate synthase [Fredinandcohnia sp. QZ13]